MAAIVIDDHVEQTISDTKRDCALWRLLLGCYSSFSMALFAFHACALRHGISLSGLVAIVGLIASILSMIGHVKNPLSAVMLVAYPKVMTWETGMVVFFLLAGFHFSLYNKHDIMLKTIKYSPWP